MIMDDKSYNLPLGTAMPIDSVNNTIAIVIILKYNGGMNVALAMYMLCLYNHAATRHNSRHKGGSFYHM